MSSSSSASFPSNTTIPQDANQGCVGPTSPDAGRADACAGCPNQSACSSGQVQTNAPTTIAQSLDIRNALSSVSYVLLVLSGKGGVGKSTLCCQIAHTLAARGYQVGVLDVDICGPSVPQMMGVSGQPVHKTANGWSPVYTPHSHIAVMSISFLLNDPNLAVVWRGPRKNAMIQQFLSETDWGELDYLLVDTPPGTSDEHISTVQYLQGALGNVNQNNASCVLGGGIVVTTPEEVSMADVRKELNFCKKTKLPIVGVVENMSIFQTRLHQLQFTDSEGADRSDEALSLIQNNCPQLLDMIVSTHIFPVSGRGPKGMAEQFDVPYLGFLPLDPNLLMCCDQGRCFVSTCPNSPSARPMNHLVDEILQALPLEDVENC